MKKENDWLLFSRLIPYAQAHKKLLFISMFLLIPLSMVGAIQPLFIGEAISLLRQEKVWNWLQNLSVNNGLIILTILLLLTTTIKLVLFSVQGYIVQQLGQQITADIRNDLFTHVTSLSTRFFDRTPVGKLITRLTSDVEALGEVFSTGAIGLIGDVLSMLVITITMFLLQWQLGLMLILMLVPVTLVIVYFQNQFRQANYQAREELSHLNSMLQENIVGINVVQIFRREKYNADLFRNTNKMYIKQVDKTIFYDSAVSATLEWISLMAIAGVLWLGGMMVLDNNISFGVLSSFILFAQRLFDPLRRFADKFTMLQAGFTSIERINNILHEPIEIKDAVNYKQIKEGRGEIKFENVSLAYKNDDYVIKDLSFTIKPGEKVALVGPTGAGKTSIIKLLCRLYEANQGQILLDGVNIKDLAQKELRRHLGVILQDGFLFAGDVQSNISLGENYTFEEIKKAAEITNIDKFIDQFPNGYNTELRERGINLSAGQKQLLAFARVAIRQPQILILDEATANLDVGTEALIQQALDKLLQGKTAIIIAHRLSTIRNVDRILVLKKGQLMETGSHEELLAKGGLYAGLYNLQMLGNDIN